MFAWSVCANCYNALHGRYDEAVPGYPFENIENGYPGAAEERRLEAVYRTIDEAKPRHLSDKRTRI
jgi:hypothetical protein